MKRKGNGNTCASCTHARANRNNHLECRVICRVVALSRPACSLHPRNSERLVA
jgi:hypothetical protein